MTPELFSEIKVLIAAVSYEELRRNKGLRAKALRLLRLLYGPFTDDRVIFAQLTGVKA